MMAKNTGKVGTVDIVKHDGEGCTQYYVKEARKAEVGEKVIITDRKRGHALGIGEVATAVYVCNRGEFNEHIGAKNPSIIGWMRDDEYNVLVPLKPGAMVTVECDAGPQAYEVSDRKAQVGDNIVIIDRRGYEDYELGDVFEVRSVDFTGHINGLRGSGFGVFRREYLTLIPVAKTNAILNETQTKGGDIMGEVVTYEGVKYRKVERAVREGDKYLVCLIDFIDVTKGKVYEITGIYSYGGNPEFNDDVNDERSCLEEGDYAVLEPIAEAPVKSIDEQIAELERLLAERRVEKERMDAEVQRIKERLKVGEYAVVLEEDELFEKGEVVKITCDDFSALPYQAEKLDSGNYAWFYPEELRRATPEEVASAAAEAKAKLAEDAERKAVEEKYRKIGRKVGEFKAGDLVKTKFHGIIEITEIREGDCHPIRFVNGSGKDDGFSLKADLELVVPVEQRFDK